MFLAELHIMNEDGATDMNKRAKFFIINGIPNT